VSATVWDFTFLLIDGGFLGRSLVRGVYFPHTHDGGGGSKLFFVRNAATGWHVNSTRTDANDWNAEVASKQRSQPGLRLTDATQRRTITTISTDAIMYRYSSLIERAESAAKRRTGKRL